VFNQLKLDNMKNAINWFEIPVRNFNKAKKFYETILGAEMQLMEAMGMKSAFFPAEMETGGIGGCIIQGEGYEPSSKGSLVYLNGGDDLGIPLSKVEAAGGKILLPKTAIGHNGFMAHFTDTEGNTIGLHSMH
jgi:predicted enzyme related to lactoylglutathione lyase